MLLFFHPISDSKFSTYLSCYCIFHSFSILKNYFSHQFSTYNFFSGCLFIFTRFLIQNFLSQNFDYNFFNFFSCAFCFLTIFQIKFFTSCSARVRRVRRSPRALKFGWFRIRPKKNYSEALLLTSRDHNFPVVNALSFAQSGAGVLSTAIIHNTKNLTQFLAEFHAIFK